jgi:hypothetical protein
MKLKYLVLSVILIIISIFIVLILSQMMAVGCLISLPLVIIALIFLVLSIKADPTPKLIPSYKMCPRCGRMIDYYAAECGWCGLDCRKVFEGVPPPVYPHPSFPPHGHPHVYYPPPTVGPGRMARQVSESSIKCKNCDKPVESDWKLCPRCGNELPDNSKPG